ncbi:MAG: hypothetical protein B0D92_08105 [Spirochaeta sp. LUC14_002_19_P3]|nr:MAG: hypothetical protein B0D92_08105 [Spirochaeta sp. LUC14_002_19_P3]
MQALIVYGSSKGRVARIAAIVSETLNKAGISVLSRNVFEVKPSRLLDYPCLILGCSTYGQGDLQQDFLEFERGMDTLDLSGRTAAVFGSGNSRYPYFAEAVDILEAKLKILGAQLLLPGYRQDMMTSSPEGEDTRQWAENLAAAIMQKGGKELKRRIL